MGLTEALFHRLIENTEDLLLAFKTPLQIEGFKKADHVFTERQVLLKQLSENLQLIAEPVKYEPLYELWQAKETELLDLVKTSLQETDQKIKEAQLSRSISKQYNSYLRQVPYGAFFDKKE